MEHMKEFFRRVGRSVKKFINKNNKRIKRNFKALGKIGAAICFILAILITLAPSVYFVFAFFFSGDHFNLVKAGAWVTFIIAPAGGTGALLFVISLITTTSVGVFLMNKKVDAVTDDEEEHINEPKK